MSTLNFRQKDIRSPKISPTMSEIYAHHRKRIPSSDSRHLGRWKIRLRSPISKLGRGSLITVFKNVRTGLKSSFFEQFLNTQIWQIMPFDKLRLWFKAECIKSIIFMLISDQIRWVGWESSESVEESSFLGNLEDRNENILRRHLHGAQRFEVECMHASSHRFVSIIIQDRRIRSWRRGRESHQIARKYSFSGISEHQIWNSLSEQLQCARFM